ncbi:MAG: hypothetical protein M3198_04630, partial [Actinomycetota bacterium]|nr:hypothetical protein [Actinomycetota bacterium]
MVAEIIGNDPLGESVLETTLDARKRLLKKDARFVPTRIRIFGLPVTIPQEEQTKRLPTRENIQNWKAWYEADFEPLLSAVGETERFFAKPETARAWLPLADPLLLAVIEPASFEQLQIDTRQESVTHSSGELSAVLVYFELELAPGISLSTHPHKCSEGNHWRNAVWSLMKPIYASAGERFSLRYAYRVPGTPNGIHFLPG